MEVGVKVDAGRVVVGLGAFRLALMQRKELLQVLGEAQMQSIYRTFAEEGSPAGSWPPLAASTLRKKGYGGGGHKLLIKSGRLRNSINPQVVDENTLVIGTNVIYAAVHQFGSRDHGVALDAIENPLRLLSNVGPHSRRVKTQDKVSTYWKGGRMRTRVVEKGSTHVKSHSRRQNIPPRPYLVFRPEDPGRIAEATSAYITHAAQSAGLEAV